MANEDEYIEDEFDDEELEEQKPGPFRRFLQNFLKGTAIGAGVGGLGTYLGAEGIRNAYITPRGFSWSKELMSPLSEFRGYVVPPGILVGGLLGGLGGVTLPYIFEKKFKNPEQKYANEYVDNFLREFKHSFRPFNTTYGLLNIAPITALAGSLGGGIIGGLKKPKTREDGTQESRISGALKGMGVGAGIGAATGIAAPIVGRFGASKLIPYLASRVNVNNPDGTENPAREQMLKLLKDPSVVYSILPNVNLADMARFFLLAKGKITPHMVGGTGHL